MTSILLMLPGKQCVNTYNMWFINKRKHNLVESGVLEGMIDAHSHLLWGVDDGARNENSTSDIIFAVQPLGIWGAFATPHIMAGLPENNSQMLPARFCERLLPIAQRVGFEVRLAGEYMLDEAFLPKLACGEKLLTYDGTHLLVEMSYLSPASALWDMIFEMSGNGYTPVMAHPERYGYLSMSDYAKLKESGCKFQLNIPSLAVAYGKQVRESAEVLLHSGMYDFIGTDVHSANMLRVVKQLAVGHKTIQRLATLVANNDSLCTK